MIQTSLDSIAKTFEFLKDGVCLYMRRTAVRPLGIGYRLNFIRNDTICRN